MHPEAKDILENLLMKDEKLKIEFEQTHKIKNDPRITTIGKANLKNFLIQLEFLIKATLHKYILKMLKKYISRDLMIMKKLMIYITF